ncbi:MAG: DUF4124 domain-containing protein [Sutterellaceae bacterium]|nr:DUF4124 domain-containing protein [Burkholderiaceae bacterium]MCX7901354.1 DUF4124 domain-containing protein [Burkholderiaceae bacterium]MDW8429438.1 DUF4124 domain-containing protein [Sutterellaceae bacterium]
MRAVALLILLIAVPVMNAAAAVYRCEGRDGRITYSDEGCPADARSTRRLDEGPAVSTATGRDAPRPAREAGSITPSRSTARFDPEEEWRRLDEQIAATRRECAELSRRVQYARQDLESAPPSLRGTAELALRRAQDQYLLYCPRR